MIEGLIAFLATALRLSTPLTLASLGGYCSERSGTVNIGLEGMMLIGAFAAAAAADATHSAWIGVGAGLFAALLLASLHAYLCVNLKADQIISGMAVNFLAAGLPPVVSKALYEMSGGTPMLDEPGERIAQVSGISPMVGLAFLMVAIFAVIHRSTRLGQYLRFAGEQPEALKSQGISVKRVRWMGILLSGALCGLAGAYLSIDHGGGFSRNMTAGRGFIALAALIIGRWTPLGAWIATLAFGVIEATQILLQGVSLPGGQTVPVQWIQMLPYVATLAILAGALGRGRMRVPKSLGTPFDS